VLGACWDGNNKLTTRQGAATMQGVVTMKGETSSKRKKSRKRRMSCDAWKCFDNVA